MHKSASTAVASTVAATVTTFEVECTYCGIRMASHVGSGRAVQYFHCPSCQRWSTSTYREVFKADTKMRPHASGPTRPAEQVSAEAVKARLDEWLRAIERMDPYRELGLSPRAAEPAIRERYRELAREHHPDRGGSADRMRRINEAYARALRHERQRRDAAA